MVVWNLLTKTKKQNKKSGQTSKIQQHKMIYISELPSKEQNVF